MATFYAEMAIEVAEQGEAEDMSWMHDQMTAGTPKLLFGHDGRLGMPMSAETTKRRRQQGGYDVERASGRGLDHSTWKELVALAVKFDEKHGAGLMFPQSFAESRNFMGAVDDFLRGFPCMFGYDEPPAGKNAAKDKINKHHKESAAVHGGKRKRAKEVEAVSPTTSPQDAQDVCRQHVLRNILLWAQRRTRECVWLDWTVEMMQGVCADKNDFLSHLQPDATFQDLAHMFGTNPFMISCWASLFMSLRAVERRAFVQADIRLWRLSRQLKSRHDGIEPSMRTLAVEALQRQRS